jgi:hypothetical protein
MSQKACATRRIILENLPRFRYLGVFPAAYVTFSVLFPPSGREHVQATFLDAGSLNERCRIIGDIYL